jgi:hypothetical protein
MNVSRASPVDELAIRKHEVAAVHLFDLVVDGEGNARFVVRKARAIHGVASVAASALLRVLLVALLVARGARSETFLALMTTSLPALLGGPDALGVFAMCHVLESPEKWKRAAFAMNGAV